MPDDTLPEGPPPPIGAPLDEQLAWCGRDVGRLHEVYLREVARDERAQHPALLAALRDRLGCWPWPDTPPAEVLAYAGRPPWPPARVLAIEEARPARYQRPEPIAELRRCVVAAGPNASSYAPVTAARAPRGLFRDPYRPTH